VRAARELGRMVRGLVAGVAIALLTIYDMCKAIDKEMEISNVRLVKKTKRAI